MLEQYGKHQRTKDTHSEVHRAAVCQQTQMSKQNVGDTLQNVNGEGVLAKPAHQGIAEYALLAKQYEEKRNRKGIKIVKQITIKALFAGAEQGKHGADYQASEQGKVVIAVAFLPKSVKLLFVLRKPHAHHKAKDRVIKTRGIVGGKGDEQYVHKHKGSHAPQAAGGLLGIIAIKSDKHDKVQTKGGKHEPIAVAYCQFGPADKS